MIASAGINFKISQLWRVCAAYRGLVFGNFFNVGLP